MKGNDDRNRLTVPMPDDMAKRLDLAAWAEQKPRAELVRDVLGEWLRQAYDDDAFDAALRAREGLRRGRRS